MGPGGPQVLFAEHTGKHVRLTPNFNAKIKLEKEYFLMAPDLTTVKEYLPGMCAQLIENLVLTVYQKNLLIRVLI